MPAIFEYLVPPFAAFAVVYGFIGLMLKTGILSGIVDHPNQRSLHTKPIPRTGGLAVMAGLWGGWFLSGMPLPILFGLSGGLVVLSCLDDIYDLKVLWRFAGHFAAAAGFITAVNFLALPPQIIVIIAIAIVWMTNLFNFMDGSDGLAGGMAFFGFGFYGIAAWLSGGDGFALACICLSAAAAGFLVYNFHPARIFMGDAGSIPLGFLAAALGLIGWQRHYWPLWFPVLTFSPFIVDASITLMRRALRGEKVWQAHREHYYQRLVRSGMGHRTTALVEYGLMSACGLSALSALYGSSYMQAGVLAAWAFVYCVLALIVDRRWHKFDGGAHAR